MGNPVYLTQSRHAVWYFRWPLPKSLHPHGRASDIKVSLETRDRREALRLARSLGYLGETLTAQGTASGMRYEDLRATLTKHFAQSLANKKAQIAEHGRLDPISLASLRNGADAAQQALDTGETLCLVGTPDEEPLGRFAALYGLNIDPASPLYRTFRDDFMRAYRDFCRAALAYDSSLDSFNLEPPAPPPVAPAAATSPAEEPTIPLSELAESFAQERVRGGNWTPKTEGDRRAQLTLLMDVLGAATPAGSVRAAQAREMKNTLVRMPRNRNKNPKTRHLTIVEAILLPDDVERVDVRTINKHLTTYSALFAWGKQNGLVAENPFDGMTIREGNKKEARDPFSLDQVKVILNELHNNAHGLTGKDYQRWGGLIGLYTGARLNEVAQIMLDDIKQHDNGIWYFDINAEGDEEDGKRLKNEASKRLVPIHPKLIDAGLLVHVDQLRKQGERYLLHELTYHKANGRGRNLSRWFNEKFLVDLGLKTPKLSFHSYRHTVSDFLAKADVSDPVIKDLIGHSQEGVTRQVYVKGSSLEQMLTAVKRLPW